MDYLVKTRVFDTEGVLRKKGEIVNLDPDTVKEGSRHVVPLSPEAVAEEANKKVPDQGQGPKRPNANKVPPAPGTSADAKAVAAKAEAEGNVQVEEGGKKRATAKTDEEPETKDGITVTHSGGGYYELSGEGVPADLDKVRGKDEAFAKRDELLALR